MMPPRKEMDEEMKTNNKKRKRKREILEENKDTEIIRYDHQDSNKLFFYRPPRLVNLVQQVIQKIEEDLGGHEIKMVIQKKKICRCDLSFHAFSIPENEILEDARDFLKPHEVEFLKKTSSQSISVSLFDHNLQQFHMFLSWWQMNNLSFYNLSHCSKEVVQRNNLKLDDMVQLWSFRRDDELGFALVKLTQ